jgi:hypothetical protein
MVRQVPVKAFVFGEGNEAPSLPGMSGLSVVVQGTTFFNNNLEEVATNHRRPFIEKRRLWFGKIATAPFVGRTEGLILDIAWSWLITTRHFQSYTIVGPWNHWRYNSRTDHVIDSEGMNGARIMKRSRFRGLAEQHNRTMFGHYH